MAREPPQNKRRYSFKIVTYARYGEFNDLLEKAKHWCYIFHDKDETDPHYHILVTFEQRKSFELVRHYVQSDQNTLAKPLEDWSGDFDYLTHSNAPDKYQYNQLDIVSDDIEFWMRKAGEAEKGEDDFVADLLDGHLTYRQMAVKYGRDYMRNFKSYMEFRCQCIAQEKEIEIMRVTAQNKQEEKLYVQSSCFQS